MRKIIIILCFLIFSSYSLFSQNNDENFKVDSLKKELKIVKLDTLTVKVYNELSREYQYIDAEKGLSYAKKGLILSEKIDWQEGVSDSYICFGINYSVLGENDKSLQYFYKALNFTKSKKRKSKIYSNIGAIYNGEGNYTKSLEFSFRSIKISEELKDFKQLAKGFNNIGNIYYFLSDDNKAILYYKKALTLNQKLNNKKGICKNLQNIAASYYLMHKDSIAIENYSKALIIGKEINDKESILYNYLSVSKIYQEKLDFKNGFESVIEGKKIALEIKNSEFYANLLQTEGELYISKSKNLKLSEPTDIKNAISALEQSLTIFKESNNLKDINLSYKFLAECYEINNNFRQSNTYYKLYSTTRDSLYNSENKETIKNLEDKREIELRDKEIKINKLSLEAKEKQKWFLLFGLLFLAIIGSLLFYQSRNRKKTNEKLQILNENLDLKNTELDEANKAKTRFFSILNHDLRGPVANLVFFLQLQKESPEMLDEESTKRMQDKTMSGAENLLNSMEDILQWSKSQMENFKPQPKKVAINSLFEDTKNHFSSEEKVQISFENKANIEINTDENYLKTIIRNLTGNAIKAISETVIPSAVEGQIIWKAWQENGTSYLSISDNGKGATDEQFKALYDDKEVVGIKTGLGLHLIRDLAKAIDCEISVDSKIDIGTTFTLKLK